jgi:2-haloacid dehalogenase
MEKQDEWPKAIFYDSKNTLFDWNPVWIKACSNIVKHYESTIDSKGFWRTWIYYHRGEALMTAFGNYREFTECLKIGLVRTFEHYGIPGSTDDVRYMLELWDEVQPFPDTLAALKKQQEMTKVLIFSNVETEYLEMMVNKLTGFRPDFLGSMQMCRALKPSPRAYNWVLEKNKLEVRDVIYCAGPQWDVQGAMACGMKAAWVIRDFWGKNEKEKLEGVKPEFIINDLHELTRIVESSIVG